MTVTITMRYYALVASVAVLASGCASVPAHPKPRYDSVWEQIMEARKHEVPEEFTCKPQSQEPISQEGVCL